MGVAGNMKSVLVKGLDKERFSPIRTLTVDGLAYRLDHQIGVGAFTTVYKASDEWGRKLAVKIYAPDVKPELWQNEVRQLRRFAGPGVIYLHQVFAHEGQTYLVMDDGGQPVARYSFAKEEDRLTVTAFVAQGILPVLHRIHRAGFFHGDISPQNVLLRTDQRQKLQAVTLVDFALSKRQEDLKAVRPAMAQWVPPPEYFEKLPIVGSALDVWHTAVLLLEILTGETLDYTEADILSGRPRQDALALRQPLPEALAAALAPDPHSRPDTLSLWRMIRSSL